MQLKWRVTGCGGGTHILSNPFLPWLWENSYSVNTKENQGREDPERETWLLGFGSTCPPRPVLVWALASSLLLFLALSGLTRSPTLRFQLKGLCPHWVLDHLDLSFIQVIRTRLASRSGDLFKRVSPCMRESLLTPPGSVGAIWKATTWPPEAHGSWQFQAWRSESLGARSYNSSWKERHTLRGPGTAGCQQWWKRHGWVIVYSLFLVLPFILWKWQLCLMGRILCRVESWGSIRTDRR